MSESATADSAYFHTLTARPYYFPDDTRDKRLPSISASLLTLPVEVRHLIYTYAFANNRVAVTAHFGCYCASDATGPYRPDHKWLLNELKGSIQQDAQHAFTQLSLWELHCPSAWDLFVRRMTALEALGFVKHVKLNVFETSRDWIMPDFSVFKNLRSVTFSPWQKGWTIDVRYREGSAALEDANVMTLVQRVIREKDGYQPVQKLVDIKHDGGEVGRGFEVFFVFPIRYLLPGKVWPYRWQLKVWRANLDSLTVDRKWTEVHLVQEATLE